MICVDLRAIAPSLGERKQTVRNTFSTWHCGERIAVRELLAERLCAGAAAGRAAIDQPSSVFWPGKRQRFSQLSFGVT